MNALRTLLTPGMRIKRWVILLVMGITFISLGIAYLITQVYRTQPFPEFVGTLTLQFIGRSERGFLFVLIGLIVTGYSLVRLTRSILEPFTANNPSGVMDRIRRYNSRGRGPKTVAIGGGTGLSTLLRGLKEYSSNLTAIVSVADDGGSSGELRRQFGMLPPGDIRQCLVALAEAEPQMTKLFQYRFDSGDGLKGHSFGNLFITAMMGATGSFDAALRESSRVLAIVGQILPTTLDNIHLKAEFEDGTTIQGETAIRHAGKLIHKLFLEPSRPKVYPEALRAILDSELIIIGPGSLYSSILPNLLIEDVVAAIRASRAVKVYVCNVATEQGETDEFLVADHISALERHVGPSLFQYVVVNTNVDVQLPSNFHSRLVSPKNGGFSRVPYIIVLADVIDDEEPRRHSSSKLAKSVMRIYYERNSSNNRVPLQAITDEVEGTPTSMRV